MIQPININIMQSYVGVVIPQYYRKITSSGTTTYNFTTPTLFQSGSTIVFANGVYKSWGVDYTETANSGISFVVGVAAGTVVEIRYNQLIPV